MKRRVFLICIFLVSLIMINCNVNAKDSNGDIVLNTPEQTGGLPLLDAIMQRRTNRQISKEMISDEELSTLLWTAWGYNSKDFKRVVPTARNTQAMDLYVATKDGFYLYDAKENKLIKKGNKDLREIISGGQEFAKGAPLHLLFVTADRKYGDFHAGSMYQNASLYCASQKLACVVRALFDRDILSKEIGLEGDSKVIMTLAVGKNQ